MRIKLTIDGATHEEMKALICAHVRVANYDAVDPQPIQAFGKADEHRGRPYVGVEGPNHYGVETYNLTPEGAQYVLAAVLATLVPAE